MARVAILLVLGWLLPAQLWAQAYPARPLKLVVGFAPGGAADQVARAYQESLARDLGLAIVVENRPGAGSSIAAEYAKLWARVVRDAGVKAD